MCKFFKLLLLVFLGACVGFVSGFLGAGGGIVLVPVLLHICKFKVKEANSTAVLIILPVCFVGAIAYIFNSVVDFSVALPVGIGSVIGGVIGTFCLKKIKSDWLVFVFSLIMIAAGIKVVF